jgi:hypothetical protein
MSAAKRLPIVDRVYIDGRIPGIACPPENDNADLVLTLSVEMDRWAAEWIGAAEVDYFTFAALLKGRLQTSKGIES